MKVFTNTVINCIVSAEFAFNCRIIGTLKYVKTVEEGERNTTILNALNTTNNWKELPITDNGKSRVIAGDFKFKDK